MFSMSELVLAAFNKLTATKKRKGPSKKALARHRAPMRVKAFRPPATGLVSRAERRNRARANKELHAWKLPQNHVGLATSNAKKTAGVQAYVPYPLLSTLQAN